MLETCIDTLVEEIEFTVPSTILIPEEDSRVDASLLEDIAGDIEIMIILN